MSIIPVRVPAAAVPVLASERRMTIRPEHPLCDSPCPVCGIPLGGMVTVLVFAGIEPESRKPGGWATGAAVAVHAACAGVPEEAPGTPPRTVTLDLSGHPDARHVLTRALEDYAAKERDLAADEGGNEFREEWAAIADGMRAQAEAAR